MKPTLKTVSQDQVRTLFRTHLPEIFDLAQACAQPADFVGKLKDDLNQRQQLASDADITFLTQLLEHEGKEFFELSTEQTLKVNTFSLLWHFLRADETEVSVDFAMDIYFQLLRTREKPLGPVDSTRVQAWMDRWPTGMNPSVKKIREENKKRIIRGLIQKIEHRHASSYHYLFPEGCSEETKLQLVETWWNDYKFQLAMAVRGAKELNYLLGGTLSEETLRLYNDAKRKGIPVFITPYYLSLLNPSDKGYDDYAIRSYVFYSRHLVDKFGSIQAWEREDKVEPGKPNAAGWICPEGGNIHRRYPEVAILIPDTMGRACGGLCASCQRMYDFQRGHLNFNLEELKPKETWHHKLGRMMDYFAEDKDLRDILITGGDALMSQNGSLRLILDAVLKMAIRKRQHNAKHDAAHRLSEIERVRLGSRLPVYLPMRIDDGLVAILKDFRQKALRAGIRQFFIQTHFQTPLEVTPEACEAIKLIQSSGWTVTNQLVFNVAASRRGHTAKLRQVLNKLGVLCYYTFTVKGFEENHEVFAPNSRSLQEQHEEKILGKLTPEMAVELNERLYANDDMPRVMRQFAQRYNLPFLSTDRSVLNLPGIGKSMTFSLVGIMPDGRRLLMFDHDHTRRHSEVIQHLPNVYILENKSVWEYLGQLEEIGENPADYHSIWYFNRGETEHRFHYFEYEADRYPLQTGKISG